MIGRMKLLDKLEWLPQFWAAFKRKYPRKVKPLLYKVLLDAYSFERGTE
jgi:hypothetical protein